MTEKRRFCPRGHDTFEIARDSSYRCLACKREDAAAAREIRRDDEKAAEWARQQEINEQVRRYEEWNRRRRERIRP